MNLENLEQNWNASQEAFADVAPADRERLLRQSVTDEVTFTTPTSEGRGLNNLVKHIEEFQKIFPGAYFKTHKLLSHHGELLTTWSLLSKDGTEVATGSTYSRYNEQARLSHIAAFMNS